MRLALGAMTLSAVLTLAPDGVARASTPTVMVLYDVLAREQVISPSGFATALIDTANAALAQSSLSDRFALAYAHPTGLNHPSGEDAIFDWIRTDTTLKSLRNQHSADVVVLVTRVGFGTLETCGSATASGKPNILSAETLFVAIVHYDCAIDASSGERDVILAHELGHITGAQHEAGASIGNAQPHAHAWVNSTLHRQTVMASRDDACGAGCETLRHYSTPTLMVLAHRRRLVMHSQRTTDA